MNVYVSLLLSFLYSYKFAQISEVKKNERTKRMISIPTFLLCWINFLIYICWAYYYQHNQLNTALNIFNVYGLITVLVFTKLLAKTPVRRSSIHSRVINFAIVVLVILGWCIK